MANYSLIRYKVREDKMFLRAPSPFDPGNVILNSGSSDYDPFLQDSIIKYSDLNNQSLSSSVVNAIKSQIEGIVDLPNASNVYINIEIVNTSSIGEIDVTYTNIDGTVTSSLKTNGSLTEEIISKIDVFEDKEWNQMANCFNCAKLSFFSGSFGNNFNFTGDIGGEWLGAWKNGQKVYKLDIPDFSSAASYGASTPYVVYWHPQVTYTGMIFDSSSISISNTHKWVCVPEAVYGTSNAIGTSSFFHVLDNFAARCPNVESGSATHNFVGKDGYFDLNLSAPQMTIGVDKLGNFIKIPEPCRNYKPNSGSIDYGYNCDGNGNCVSAPSGSPGVYSTLAECEATCSVNLTSSGFNCTPNGCVQAPSGTTGTYTTLIDCNAKCSTIPVTSSCLPCVGNYVLDSTFESGSGTPHWNVSSTSTPAGMVAFDGVSAIGVPQPNSGLFSASVGSHYLTGSVTLTQSVWAFQSPCTYSVCFEAWVGSSYGMNGAAQNLPPNSFGVILDPGPVGITTANGAILDNAWLTNTPTAFTYTLNANTSSGDLVFHFFNNLTGSVPRLYLDNICVNSQSCTFTQDPTQSNCIITGSSTCYTEVTYSCDCPDGFTEVNGECMADQTVTVPKVISGSIVTTTSAYHKTWGTAFAILHFTRSGEALGIHGGASSSIGTGTPSSPQHPSPVFNNPSTHPFVSKAGNGSTIDPTFHKYNQNTQFTFDYLKDSMWWYPQQRYQGPSGLTDANNVSFPESLLRNIPNDGFFYGGGSYLNTTSSKTVYVGLIADDGFRFKLNGQTVVELSTYTNPSFGQPSGSVNFVNQQIRLAFSRTANGGNPYPIIPTGVNENIFNGSSGQKWNQDGGNMTYRMLHIYPATMPSGCNFVSLEGRDGVVGTSASFGGVIFDNTFEEIVSASSEDDLNLIWDSRINILHSVSGSGGLGATCPPNTIELGSSDCDLCTKSGSIVPCGACIYCDHGKLYNGFVMDQGGSNLSGRGTGGVVNISATTNSINTWVVPNELDWGTLITQLNSGNSFDQTLQGQLHVTASNVGGKLKDCTQSPTASCFNLPNLGADICDASDSGWKGTAGGRRDDTGVFSGMGLEGNWWSVSSSVNSSDAMAYELKSWDNDVYRNIYAKNYGFSLRLCRPSSSGEVNGQSLTNIYTGNDGKVYDGIVIGSQVWITKNLEETKYNNGNLILNTTPNNQWSNFINNPTTASSCFYDNTSSLSQVAVGNIDPSTGDCYSFKHHYVYEECNTGKTLIQEESGSTTTAGQVEKAADSKCYKFVTILSSSFNINVDVFSPTNYFSGSRLYTGSSACDEYFKLTLPQMTLSNFLFKKVKTFNIAVLLLLQE